MQASVINHKHATCQQIQSATMRKKTSRKKFIFHAIFRASWRASRNIKNSKRRGPISSASGPAPTSKLSNSQAIIIPKLLGRAKVKVAFYHFVFCFKNLIGRLGKLLEAREAALSSETVFSGAAINFLFWSCLLKVSASAHVFVITCWSSSLPHHCLLSNSSMLLTAPHCLITASSLPPHRSSNSSPLLTAPHCSSLLLTAPHCSSPLLTAPHRLYAAVQPSRIHAIPQFSCNVRSAHSI